MSTSIEAQGHTVDEAIQIALNQLGVSRDKVEIDILHHPRRGVLGIGARRAKVRATIRESVMLDGEEFDMSGGSDLDDKPRRRRRRGGRSRGEGGAEPGTEATATAAAPRPAPAREPGRPEGDRRGGGRRGEDGGRGRDDRRGGRGQGGQAGAEGSSGRQVGQQAPGGQGGRGGQQRGGQQRDQRQPREGGQQRDGSQQRDQQQPRDGQQPREGDGRRQGGRQGGREDGRDRNSGRGRQGGRGQDDRRGGGDPGRSEASLETIAGEEGAMAQPAASRPSTPPPPRRQQPVIEEPPLDAETLELVRARADELVRELLEKMGFPAEVTSSVDIAAGEAVVSVRSESEGLLIGRRGQTLDSLEHIVNRMVLRGESYVEGRVLLDIGDYRKRRRESLDELAARLRGRAVGERRSVQVSPMSPRDRKYFALAFAGDESVEVRALGAGFYRRVIVAPAGMATSGMDVENVTADTDDFEQQDNAATTARVREAAPAEAEAAPVEAEHASVEVEHASVEAEADKAGTENSTAEAES